MSEVNSLAVHISLSGLEADALVEVLSDRVVWQDTDLDAYWQDTLHELFAALGVEVIT